MAWESLPETTQPPRPLQDSLGSLSRRIGLARPDHLRLLEEHWSSLLGPLAASCRLEAAHQEVIVISVDDPALAEHLRWSCSELLSAVNRLCGGEAFSDLKVKVAR